ncbi:disease resistance protein RGA3 [Canna indica]|uniref:Disease resistance protein RGA3 n=1 Tax=Canna indica TaxID=4628 RepID=A0AAQ3KJ19_9LILI|nr:disease resistance protein RGA3 [Canna indica]
MAIVARVDPFFWRLFDALVGLLKEEVVHVWGIKGNLEKLKGNLDKTKALLQDSESWIEQEFKSLWVRDLQNFAYDAEDIMELCLIHRDEHPLVLQHNIRSVLCCFSSSSLRCFPCTSFTGQPLFGIEMGKKLEQLDNNLEQIYTNGAQQVRKIRDNNDKGKSTDPYPTVLVGEHIKESKNSLVNSIVEETRNQLQVFAIVGMTGIGKTSLAKAIFNNETISRCFAIRVWLYVPQSYSNLEALDTMVIFGPGKDYKAVKTLSSAELYSLMNQVRPDEPVLIVLDNVHRAEVYRQLRETTICIERSNIRIIVTTRNRALAREMGAELIYNVPNLSIMDSLELLRREVGMERDQIKEFENIGKQIVSRCDFLPLAVEKIGMKLRNEKSKEHWKDVLQSNDALKNVMEELELSYIELKRPLKRCFNYFCLFPPNFSFYTDKITRLWIAEGFIKQNNIAMEKSAECYFKELVDKSFLQADCCETAECYFKELVNRSSLRADCCKTKFKVKSLLHATAMSQINHENFYGDMDQLDLALRSGMKLRRLSLACNSMVINLPKEVRSCLRTLLLFNSPKVRRVEDDLFNKLPHLRILDISFTSIESLPESIQNLKLLKHLDLSHTPIVSLPERIGDLKDLQFLNLIACRLLHSLPGGITKLCKLGVLAVEEKSVTHLPKGMGEMKLLSHLQGYVVADNYAQHSSSLMELTSLSQLTFLSLFHLEKASTPTDQVLNKLTHLSNLQLHCSDYQSSPHQLSQQTPHESREIYEKLCPPDSLEELTISSCCFFPPSWMEKKNLKTSFPNLTKLVITSWTSHQLPPLGQIPKLQYLRIEGAHNVEFIEDEFVGGCPTLESLILHRLSNWREWDMNASLPQLKYLEIAHCPQLMALPGGLMLCTALEKMEIFLCSALRHDQNYNAVRQAILRKKERPQRLKDLVASSNAETSTTGGSKAQISANGEEILPYQGEETSSCTQHTLHETKKASTSAGSERKAETD